MRIPAALLLIALFAACESGTPTVKTAPGGEFIPGAPAKTTVDKAGPGGKPKFKGAGAFLPNTADLKDLYSLVQGPEYYTKDTLFEVIDGASDSYIAYGMTEMAKAVYKPKSGEYQDEINVEVYEFSPELGGLGKFALERSGCRDSEKRTNWCLRDGDLLFWKGRKLVKVGAFDNTPAAMAAVGFFSAQVDAAITEQSAEPAFFQRFPKEHRISGGGGWSPRSLYGVVGLKNVFLYTYRPPGEKYKPEGAVVTLFAVQTSEGRSLFDRFKEAAAKTKNGKISLRPLDIGADSAFIYSDGYGTHTVLLKGDIVAGGRDFLDEETAGTMSKTFREAL
jgi:hypothetical protein